jgi:DNA-binding HxlR family transcriptional regulator
MYRYGEYCPLAKTTSAVGDYWTPLIVRELLHGRQHFNDLVRSLPDISRSLLATRLRLMERSGILERRGGDTRNVSNYVLTEAGRDLGGVLDAMSAWGERWTDNHTALEDMHPMTTVCMLRARCQGPTLPSRRVVIQVVTKPPKQSTSWLVLENGFASLCENHPGFDIDLIASTDVETLYSIWLDQLSVSAAVESERIRLEGEATTVRSFPSWFGAISADYADHFEAMPAR